MKRMTVSATVLGLMVAASGVAFAAEATKVPVTSKAGVHATVTKDDAQKKDQAETK